MRIESTTKLGRLGLMLVLMFTLTFPALADDATGVLYNGQAVADAGITLGNWGGGSGSDSTDIGFTSQHNSIKITTQGLYQGATITFSTPPSLGNLRADKTRYLVIRVAVPSLSDNSSVPVSPLKGPHLAGASPASGVSLLHLAQYNQRPGQMPQPMQPSQPNQPNQNAQPGQTATQAPPPVTVSKIHLVITLASGAQAEMVRTIPDPASGDTYWLRLAIPLAAIAVPDEDAAGAQLKTIQIGTDLATTLFIGQMRLISDPTPISANAGSDQDVARGDIVQLQATADAGVTNLNCMWDFNTQDLFQDQADGRNTTHVYSKSGTYKVTLTVTDPDGIKKPATSVCNVKVEE